MIRAFLANLFGGWAYTVQIERFTAGLRKMPPAERALLLLTAQKIRVELDRGELMGQSLSICSIISAALRDFPEESFEGQAAGSCYALQKLQDYVPQRPPLMSQSLRIWEYSLAPAMVPECLGKAQEMWLVLAEVFPLAGEARDPDWGSDLAHDWIPRGLDIR